MGRKRIQADQLTSAVNEIVVDYKEGVEQSIGEAAVKAAKEGRQTLRQTSPKNTGHYARGWSYGKKKNGARIYNKTDAPLVHLLEYGHALRQGGRSPAIPHVKPVRDDIAKLFENEVKVRIKKVK